MQRTSTWVDPKRNWWWLGLVVPLLPFVGVILWRQTGYEAFLWIGPVVLYVIVPLLDAWIGEDSSNPPQTALAGLAAERRYLWVLFVFLPLQYLGLALGLWLAVQGGLGMLGWLGLLATTGLVSGAGINVAHELGHRREPWAIWLARLALAPACYGHFQVEHNRGHHVRVATPEDPASARLGESYWRFLPRTLFGSLRSAWSLERDRLQRSGLPAWHWRNHILQAWSLSLLLVALVAAFFGPLAVLFFVAQAMYGAALLETVNYIEHYGLLRRRDAQGRLERCQPEHSWNSNHLVSNLLLFQLQRHSDHHANPTRPYQALRHFEDAPQLPAGYAALIPVACLPPLWFWLMDRRVLAHYQGDRGRCNLGLQPVSASLSRS